MITVKSSRIVSTPAINLSRNKMAKQSHEDNGRHAQRAVDGNESGHFEDSSCTKIEAPYAGTEGSSETSFSGGGGGGEPFDSTKWWYVDLGQLSNVTSVRLVNRQDCCQDELSGIVVEVSQIKPEDMSAFPMASFYDDEICGRIERWIPESKDLTIKCMTRNGNIGITGRYVRVVREKGNVLYLCEVDVKGRYLSDDGGNIGIDGNGNDDGFQPLQQTQSQTSTGPREEDDEDGQRTTTQYPTDYPTNYPSTAKHNAYPSKYPTKYSTVHSTTNFYSTNNATTNTDLADEVVVLKLPLLL